MAVEDRVVNRSELMKGAAAGAAALLLGGAFKGLRALAGEAAPAFGKGAEWRASTCQGCTSWCSVRIQVRDGRAVKVAGNPDSKVNRGHCCPKSHLALQEVYDPDRLKTPMKRTNPRKGRNEDPGFVPITWDEALDALADKIMELRRSGETHKFLLMRGRYTFMNTILYANVPRIVGSPNNISHSSICAEAEKFGPYYTEGLWNYRQYDVTNARYILLWGADPLSSNRQVSYYLSVWGEVLDQAEVAVVDPRFSASAAKADHWLPVKPGEDGALAVAIAHVLLAEGLWSKEFVGDFKDGAGRFVPGQAVDEDAFEERHTHGLVKWWNIELKDRTPQWAAERTGLPEEQILRVARGFGRAAPHAICWVGGGPAMQVRGAYASMAAHALNGLVGSVDNVGGTLQPNAIFSVGFPDPASFMDEAARRGVGQRKIDGRDRMDMPGIKDGKSGAAVVTNQTAEGILNEDPYDIKVAVGYMNNFAFSCPQAERWERALSKLPFFAHITTHASETTWFADIALPAANNMFERWGFASAQGAGFRHVSLLEPAIEPVWDAKADETEIPWLLAKKLADRGFPNLLDYCREFRDPETGREPTDEKEFNLYALKHATRPLWDPAQHKGGDRIGGWDEFVRRGVWNSDPYPYRARWSSMKTKTGKFEFYSETLREALSAHADKHGTTVDAVLEASLYQAKGEQAFVPHYEAPFMRGDEQEYPFVHVDYKSRLNREGRSANTPWYQEFKDVDPGDEAWGDVAKLNPADARRLGIRDGDAVRLVSPTGEIRCTAKLWEGVRPGTVAKCYGQGHWAYGRVASAAFGKKPLGGNNNDIIPADYDRLSGSTAFYGLTRLKVLKA